MLTLDLTQPHKWCGFKPHSPAAAWGYLESAQGDWGNNCEHQTAVRYCDCCSMHWWQVGLAFDGDEDGPARQNCPDCVVWAAANPEEYARGEAIQKAYRHLARARESGEGLSVPAAQAALDAAMVRGVA